jgi:hypothetical protein
MIRDSEEPARVALDRLRKHVYEAAWQALAPPETTARHARRRRLLLADPSVRIGTFDLTPLSHRV